VKRRTGPTPELAICHDSLRTDVTYTTVESVPPDPENTRSHHHEQDVVRLEVLTVLLQTGTNPPGADESRGARAQMNDVSAGIIEDAHLEEEAATPQAICADTVAESEPQRHEEHPGREIHASQERSRNEDEGDRSEDELEVNHGCKGKVLRHTGRGQTRLTDLHACGEDWTRYAGKWEHVFTKTDFVRPDHPANQHHGEGVERHKH